jgi:hypothetical protein
MESENVSPECGRVLAYFNSVSMNNERFTLDIAEAASDLGVFATQIMPRIEELVAKGYLELRTGSRQPGAHWNGLPGVVVTPKGRKAAKEYRHEG